MGGSLSLNSFLSSIHCKYAAQYKWGLLSAYSSRHWWLRQFGGSGVGKMKREGMKRGKKRGEVVRGGQAEKKGMEKGCSLNGSLPLAHRE